MKSNRLFEILMILIHKRKITSSALATHFEVSLRTIYRDIEALSIAGIPVYTTTGKNGGVHLMDNYVLDKSFIPDKEQSEVLLALKSLSTVPNIDETKVLSRLLALFDQKQNHRNLDWVEVDFSRWQSTDHEQELFNQLKQAILNKQVIQFDYINAMGEESMRTVDPLKLIFKFKDWYVHGYCKNKNDFRMFKLLRIKNYQTLPLKIEKEYMDVPVPYQNNYVDPNHMIHVELLFPKNVAHKVYEWFDSQYIFNENEQQLRVSGTLIKDDWFFSSLLAFGSDIVVEEPLYVKAELIRRHLKAAEDLGL